jgi:hypothetical protein
MLRFLGISSMGIIFLLISPKLRGQVMGVIGDGVHFMDLYSPISYIVGGVGVIALLLVSLYRGAQARPR